MKRQVTARQSGDGTCGGRSGEGRSGSGGGRLSEHPLAHVRRIRGWSYQELARVVADNARALGVPMAARREKVWRWEHWGVVPEPDSQRALARALGVPMAELAARPWPSWLPGHTGMPIGLPWTADGGLRALEALLDGGADDSRGYAVLVGAELRDAVREWAAAPATGCEPPAGTPDGTVDEATVSWLEEGVTGLRRLEGRLGGDAVRHRVDADLRTVHELLGQGSYSHTVGVRLFRVAADLTLLGGWAATDSGRHAAAQRHFLTGLRMAHAARDRSIAAALLGGLSLQAVLTGRPQDAVATADEAARAARAAGNPRVRAMTASRQARAYAALGDEAACRGALARARDRLSAAGHHRDPPWIGWFDAAALDGNSGLALLDLGHAEEARTALERALERLGPDRLRDGAVYALGAAVAQVMAGAPGRGRELADAAARRVPGQPSPRLTASFDAVRALLAEHGASRPARGLDDRRGSWSA